MSKTGDDSRSSRGDEASKAKRSRTSRRAFIGGTVALGAGAATVASAGGPSVINPFDSGSIHSRRPQEGAELLSHPSPTFGRLFPDLPPFAEPTDALRAAMQDIGRPGGLLDANDDLSVGPIELITNPDLSVNNRDNPNHTAGTTFFGQFLDHDLTFDTTSELGVPVDPNQSTNTRTAYLDLDSVYGGGPSASPQLYDPNDRAKLRIEDGGLFEDLPRDANQRAVIADPRNDENMMISGLHAAFILFHNKLVDQVRDEGRTSGVFTEARRRVRFHYQWIIVHEFLPQVISQARTDSILRQRLFYRPNQAFIPVDFQVGYRMGHSMIRPSYRANLAGDPSGSPDTGAPAFFGMIFDPAGEGQADPVDLRGGARTARRFIGWQTFFDFEDGEIKRNKRLDTSLSTPLFNLPLQTIPSQDPPTSLPTRNLLRHITWTLPSGQAVARRMGAPVLSSGDLSELSSYGLGLERSTPLWYYILKEAEVMNDGLHLGPVGGRIIGEVFIGVLRLDPNSYLNRFGWRPTLPSHLGSGQFDVRDLLTFAEVDPASRGQ